MRTPTELELQHLLGTVGGTYDPVKAHDYYIRTRKLKGRQPGAGKQPVGSARSNRRRLVNARVKQKQELQAHITNLEKRLGELEDLIQVKEAALKRSLQSAKGNAKKERAAKEKDKPKTAAEKAKIARENKKYRDAHKQELKTKAKRADSKSGGGTSGKKKSATPKKASIAELKTLATKVRGQLAIAKSKLAAL